MSNDTWLILSGFCAGFAAGVGVLWIVACILLRKNEP